MTWLDLAQQQANHSTDAVTGLVVAIVTIIVVTMLVVYAFGRSDGRSAELGEDGRYRYMRNSIDGLIDDAEQQIRRQMWRKP